MISLFFFFSSYMPFLIFMNLWVRHISCSKMIPVVALTLQSPNICYYIWHFLTKQWNSIYGKIFRLHWVTFIIFFFHIFFCSFWHWSHCTLSEGNYLISYLATRGAQLEPFVIGSLIQLFCRVTKFGWFDDERFREVVKETMDFLSQVIWRYHTLSTPIF